MSKPLAVYNAKRDFRKTAEPKGARAKRAGNSFVIQKHAASRLHYDFRLELDGVLKSWAVARGPSLVPGEKRLAVHVEDHPLAYGGFEGTIPQGEYGGGTVMLWDRGTWEPEGDARKDYEKGRLTFTLEGEKLHGAWHLVRMRSRPGAARELAPHQVGGRMGKAGGRARHPRRGAAVGGDRPHHGRDRRGRAPRRQGLEQQPKSEAESRARTAGGADGSAAPQGRARGLSRPRPRSSSDPQSSCGFPEQASRSPVAGP